MKRVFVSGSSGFLGSRAVAALQARGDDVVTFERDDRVESLPELVRGCDAILHLAGVNRPEDPAEFMTGNADLTTRVVSAVAAEAPRAVVCLSSSTQAALDNAYGASKRAAEESVSTLAESGASVVVFRFPNLFGPGARPNYNSAVATFAHNAAHGLPIDVHDPARALTLLNVHDAVNAMLTSIDSPPSPGRCERREAAPTYATTVGEVADLLASFARTRHEATLPRIATRMERELYATYLSYVPMPELAYGLTVHRDNRGGLAEFLRAPALGQIFVSRTLPGITRGNHYHFTKTEKFFVVEGEAIVRFRPVSGGDITEHRVNGREYRVVDIPPDHAHSIENVGDTELVVLFWASEPFDPAHPDTIPMNVIPS